METWPRPVHGCRQAIVQRLLCAAVFSLGEWRGVHQQTGPLSEPQYGKDFDLLEALLGDGGDIVDGQLEQFTPRMCPAIGQLNGGVITPIFDTVIACIAIYLQHAAEVLQYLDRMLARATWRISEGNTWWR